MKDYYGWLKEQELHKKKKEKESSLKREDREKKSKSKNKKRRKKIKKQGAQLSTLFFASFFYLKSDILFIFFKICSKIL